MEDVAKMLQQAAFSKVTGDESMDIVAFGAMDAKEAPAADKEYAFSLEVELAPEFKMPNTKRQSPRSEKGKRLRSTLRTA